MGNNRTLARRLVVHAIVAASLAVALVPAASARPQSAARQWDEELLQAIRINTPRPPVHARNLYHTSVAMWDAWAAYDALADQVIHHEHATAVDVETARAEAISFAAYRVLKQRFATGPGSAVTQVALDARMTALGYDKNFTSTVGPTPAALGNRIAASVLAFGFGDGSNQVANYAPNNGYVPANLPLIIALPGTIMADPNRWQPLAFDYYVKQNGIIVGAATQSFVCPHWRGVKPFALSEAQYGPNAYLDPGPQPRLGGVGDAQFRADMLQLILFSSVLTTNDGVMMDISPAALGNNTLGLNDGVGRPLNPVTGQPYAPNLVPRGDYRRVQAEFWSDGPDSETPPGHWHVLANQVADYPGFEKRIGGVGPVVSDLEWDVKVYLVIAGAAHDAAIAAWGCKGYYDSVRPISAIRYMCGHGQCSNPFLPSFDAVNGIPLVTGLTALITPESVLPGGVFHHLVEDYVDPFGNAVHDEHVGDIAIRAWRGQPANPNTQASGVGWILGEKWMTYMQSTFVTPPFAGYTSGHSTFSRATAEAMTAVTGSQFFPGGLGEHLVPVDGLNIEAGPSVPVRLQWATYYDAADEAGLSRLYGGIHPRMDDGTARLMGSQVGVNAWAQAQRYFNGTACPLDFKSNDGSVNVEELLEVILAWGPCVGGSPCFADVHVNGRVDVNDLLDVVLNWGSCP